MIKSPFSTIENNQLPIELMPEFPNCPWCLQPMEKTGSGISANLSYRSTSFICLYHPHEVWISIRHDDKVFNLNLIHFYIGERLRIKYNPTHNIIALQEPSFDNMDAWMNICHLNPNPDAWPQNLNYNDLINKINSFLLFI